MPLWFCIAVIFLGTIYDVIAQNSSSKICGIKPPGDHYPWLVGFEFPSYEPRPRIECTGALIDRRHVLGKNDCFRGVLFLKIPKSVRLGPYSTITDDNCVVDYYNDDNNCTDVGGISIPIEVVITHPEYDAEKSFLFPSGNAFDIALVRLREIVTYTDVIRPICLPSIDITHQTATDGELIIAGLTLDIYNPTKNENYQEITRYLERTKCHTLRDMPVAEDNICTTSNSTNNSTSCLRTGALLMNKNKDKYELVGLLELKTGCAPIKVFNHMYSHVVWIRSEIQKWIHGCGKRKVKHVELIVNGEGTNAGDWPWHIAIYRNNTYICGGTLISKFTVLTAAHCVTVGGQPASPDIFQVILGKHYLFGGDIETQNKDVRSVIVHEEFASRNHLNNDIALLKLKTEATYNDYVQPACIWSNEVYDRLPDNTDTGTVVGWGFDQLEWLSSQLKRANIPKVSDRTCIDKNPLFYTQVLRNKKKFCAGWANGTSTCNGDSGGGFVMFVPDTAKNDTDEVLGSWYVRGIVSLSHAVRNKGRCDPYQYVVFTDIANYTTWINRNLADELRPTAD